MNLKADTEYIFKTGNTISYDGTIPLKQMQEIVRCKDCKHKGWIQEPCHGKSVDFCNVFDSTINNPEKCFCYYGERRKNERAYQKRGSV